MNNLRLSRRRLLQGSLAGAASLPLVRLLGESSVRAQDAALTNFICVYHPHGVAAEFWAMKPNDTETSFDLSYENCSLQPFDDAATYGKSFKDKLLIIEGIDHLSNANGHDSAGTILTGSRIDGKKPQNASLDQVLAVEREDLAQFLLTQDRIDGIEEVSARPGQRKTRVELGDRTHGTQRRLALLGRVVVGIPQDAVSEADDSLHARDLLVDRNESVHAWVEVVELRR